MPTYQYVNKTGQLATVEAKDSASALAAVKSVADPHSGVSLVTGAAATPVAAPAATTAIPSGTLPALTPPTPPTLNVTGTATNPLPEVPTPQFTNLGNLKASLRDALNEAARARVESNYKQVAPLSKNIPGTMGSIVDLIRGGIKTPVETTFSDIVGTFRETNEAKTRSYERAQDARERQYDRLISIQSEENRVKLQIYDRELALYESQVADKKQERQAVDKLRLEFGSIIPADADLETALAYATPEVDRLLKEEQKDKGPTAKTLTRTDVQQLGLPVSLVGTTWGTLQSQLESNTPPAWFRTMIENERKQSILPSELITLWNEFRGAFNDTFTSSGTDDFDNL